MYRVYYSNVDGSVGKQDDDDLGVALKIAATLREEGKLLVTMATMNPSCTSLPGASLMKIEDYDWKKRR